MSLNGSSVITEKKAVIETAVITPIIIPKNSELPMTLIASNRAIFYISDYFTPIALK